MKEARHFYLFLTKTVSTVLPKLGLFHTVETEHWYGEVRGYIMVHYGYIMVHYFQEQGLESEKWSEMNWSEGNWKWGEDQLHAVKGRELMQDGMWIVYTGSEVEWGGLRWNEVVLVKCV
jgi:hypothetical protein